MMKSLVIRACNALCVAAFLLLVASAGNAFGNTFTLTWTGPDGPGTAVLVATQDSTDVYTVTSLTGVQDGLSITLLAVDTYGENDNEILQPPGYSYIVDEAGLAFTDGINDYSIFGEITPAKECSSAVNGPCVGGYAVAAPQLTTSSLTPGTSTVPEPTSAGLAGIMLLGAAAVIRRKYRV